jgi:small subunit ribosomal protein S3
VGRKVHPIGFRIGIKENWRSRWYAEKDYQKFVVEDMEIRRHIMRKLHHGAISRIEIERKGEDVKVDIYTARPGVVIGRKGAEVDALRKELEKKTGNKLQINIQEVKIPQIDASLIAQSIAEQIEARVSHRRAMKKAIAAAMRFGAKGIKIACSGRLRGSEYARREWYREGRVPLHTLRTKIDYGFAEANTKYGQIGVKVWLHLGELLAASGEERTESEIAKDEETRLELVDTPPSEEEIQKQSFEGKPTSSEQAGEEEGNTEKEEDLEVEEGSSKDTTQPKEGEENVDAEKS